MVTPHATVRGTAVINILSPGRALYLEDAQVRLATGETLAGKQSYLYQRQEAGFDILFAKTKLLFQSLHFQRNGDTFTATAVHQCLQDNYSSEYVLRTPGSMFVRHVVRGPAKDYVSATTFQRISHPRETSD